MTPFSRFDQDRRDRRTELLARMAAELAAPLIARNRERRSFETEDDVCDGIANTAVDIARRILARCEATDG